MDPLREELVDLRKALAHAEWRGNELSVALRVILRGCEKSGQVNHLYRVVSTATLNEARKIMREVGVEP